MRTHGLTRHAAVGALLVLASFTGCDDSASGSGSDAGPPFDAGPHDSGPPFDGPAVDAPGARCTASAECQDGMYCNGIELCGADGTCHAGTAPCVSYGVMGTCDEAADRCAGTCEAMPLGAPRTCPPFTHCTTAAECDDGNFCTRDTCLAAPFGDSCGCSHTSAACLMDAECDDHVFCDGIERCMPGAAGADCRGCVPAASPACAAGYDCSEALTRCTLGGSCATMSDADFDGHRSLPCGGDDCNDGDPNEFPGNFETCNAHDEDCDPTTYGPRDRDGDGWNDGVCCNTSSAGMRFCGPDCDDTNVTAHPGQLELCNGVDDDCNGMIDDGTSVTLYVDADGDGAGNAACSHPGCPGGPGTSTNGNDCDDTNPAIRGPGDIECGPHRGTRTCGAMGRWGVENSCPGGQSCRAQPNGTGLCL